MKKINLTRNEESLFKLIKEYSNTLADPPTPRAAGGWIRDKLLNKESHDIDIALDTISGYEFAIGLNLYRKGSIDQIGLVKSNPDKSKHLETAILKIKGFSIDFNALRTEEYSDTRIPKILLGTAKEDALRRDLTINSLFYNIITEEIEDFTGMGLHDLEKGIIRTPLDPLTTFYDDPLRILRTFRFACRFNFEIHFSIYEALKNEELKIHLQKKVSNERIGVEIKKIIEFDNSIKIFNDFIKYNLVESIFKPEIKKRIFILEEELICFYKKEIPYFLRNFTPKKEILNLYFIFIFFCNEKKAGKKEEFLNKLICKDSLKYENKFTNEIAEIENGISVLINEKIKISKVNLIKLVRKMGKNWQNSFYFAVFYLKINKLPFDFLIILYASIIDYGLEDVYDVIPCFRGTDVISRMDLKKDDIKFAIEDGIVYKILNPKADKEEILIYLKQIYERK